MELKSAHFSNLTMDVKESCEIDDCSGRIEGFSCDGILRIENSRIDCIDKVRCKGLILKNVRGLSSIGLNGVLHSVNIEGDLIISNCPDFSHFPENIVVQGDLIIEGVLKPLALKNGVVFGSAWIPKDIEWRESFCCLGKITRT